MFDTLQGNFEVVITAITVGEAGGIGPEITLRCLAQSPIASLLNYRVYGPVDVLRWWAERLSLPMPPDETLVDVGGLSVDQVTAGRFDAASGAASFAAVERAIDDAVAGRVDAVVTGPIQKEAWAAAGIAYPGHTELLAEKTGVDDYHMMLCGEALAVVLVTIHIPLADVPSRLTTAGVERCITAAADVARRRRKGQSRRPAITVCGLNPHAGENGMFSRGEEESIITPAIEASRATLSDIEIRGPVPPDTAFTPAARQAADVHVCMYHDQGLIPLKALSFDDGVNVTLGLPIVRTSVDHGTAMDLAGRGVANHRSLRAAIRMAAELAT